MGMWKTIGGGWEAFKDGIGFKMGFGNRVTFWKDKWHGDMPLRESCSECYSLFKKGLGG